MSIGRSVFEKEGKDLDGFTLIIIIRGSAIREILIMRHLLSTCNNLQSIITTKYLITTILRKEYKQAV